jgi:hypothetical protein
LSETVGEEEGKIEEWNKSHKSNSSFPFQASMSEGTECPTEETKSDIQGPTSDGEPTKVNFQWSIPTEELETGYPIPADDPIHQKLFDRLPIPKSERLNFFNWLIKEEYVRQAQERAAERDVLQAKHGDEDERGKGPETLL